jgi:predicted molibdopterin-dependent oxidoreductase YjgC
MSSDPIGDSTSLCDPRLDLRIAGSARTAVVSFRFDGQRIRAFEGESVACALFAAGIRTLRQSPRTEMPRGLFCLMGSCQECVVWVDGRRVAACQEPVREGLEVRDGTIERAP